MAEIKIVGIEKLQGKLKKNVKMDDVRKVVHKNGADLQKKAQKNAPIDTGHLRDSIMIDERDHGLTTEVAATAEYSAYVEYGTRFMNAQPYMRPAFEVQKEKFKQDMKKLTR